MKLQKPRAAGNNLPPPSPLNPEQIAFRRGANGLPCTYGNGRMRRAWLAGRTFAEHQRAGLRPLDTVIEQPAPAGRP